MFYKTAKQICGYFLSSSQKMGGPDPYRSLRNKFNKRKRTILKKSYDLVTLCDAKVYLLVIHEGGQLEFNSVEDGSFPPSHDFLICFVAASAVYSR